MAQHGSEEWSCQRLMGLMPMYLLLLKDSGRVHVRIETRSGEEGLLKRIACGSSIDQQTLSWFLGLERAHCKTKIPHG